MMGPCVTMMIHNSGCKFFKRNNLPINYTKITKRQTSSIKLTTKDLEQENLIKLSVQTIQWRIFSKITYLELNNLVFIKQIMWKMVLITSLRLHILRLSQDIEHLTHFLITPWSTWSITTRSNLLETKDIKDQHQTFMKQLWGQLCKSIHRISGAIFHHTTWSMLLWILHILMCIQNITQRGNNWTFLNTTGRRVKTIRVGTSSTSGERLTILTARLFLDYRSKGTISVKAQILFQLTTPQKKRTRAFSSWPTIAKLIWPSLEGPIIWLRQKTLLASLLTKFTIQMINTTKGRKAQEDTIREVSWQVGKIGQYQTPKKLSLKRELRSSSKCLWMRRR